MIVPQSDSNLTKSCSIQTLENNIFLISKLSHLTLTTPPKQVSQTTPKMNLPHLRLQDMTVPQSDSNLTNSCLIQTLGKNVFHCSKLFLLNLLMRPKHVSQTILEIKLPQRRLQGMIVLQSDSNLTKSCSFNTLGNNVFLSSKLSHLTLTTPPKQVSQTTF